MPTGRTTECGGPRRASTGAPFWRPTSASMADLHRQRQLLRLRRRAQDDATPVADARAAAHRRHASLDRVRLGRWKVARAAGGIEAQVALELGRPLAPQHLEEVLACAGS